jgi:hypothetical protein
MMDLSNELGHVSVEEYLLHLALADIYENVDFKKQAVKEDAPDYVFEGVAFDW